MILSDRDLQAALSIGSIVVDPLDVGAIQPASIDLRLGREFATFSRNPAGFGPQPMIQIDPFGPERTTHEFTKLRAECYSIYPGEFILAHTLERVEIGAEYVARIEGRSTLGRLGLIVHATAGFVDPGWKGELTLEMYNASPNKILLRYGMPIAQLAVELLSGAAERPYGHPSRRSKYQEQRGAQPAKRLVEGT